MSPDDAGRRDGSAAASTSSGSQLIDISGPFLSLGVLLEAFPQGLDATTPSSPRASATATPNGRPTASCASRDPGTPHCLRSLRARARCSSYPTSFIATGRQIPPTRRRPLSRAPRHPRARARGRRDRARLPMLLIVVDAPGDGRSTSRSPSAASTPPRPSGCGCSCATPASGPAWSRTARSGRSSTPGRAHRDASPPGTRTTCCRGAPHACARSAAARRAATLRRRRPENTLDGLFERSRDDEREVTDQLGLQVRRAVELLVSALRPRRPRHRWRVVEAVDSSNEHAEQTTLRGRRRRRACGIIFLLAAEARGLLPDDEPWVESYAVTPLRAELEAARRPRTATKLLDRRFDAWPRLLATFRAVHGGVEHDRVRLPGYGGGLFDPDRYPFLEGADGQTLAHLEPRRPARPRRPPDARGRGARRTRAPAAQLPRARRRADRPRLRGSARPHRHPRRRAGARARRHSEEGARDRRSPSSKQARAKGEDTLLELLDEETGRSRSALKKALDAEPTPSESRVCAQACEHDATLVERVLPFLGLVRDDVYGAPDGLPRRARSTSPRARPARDRHALHAAEPHRADRPVRARAGRLPRARRGHATRGVGAEAPSRAARAQGLRHRDGLGRVPRRRLPLPRGPARRGVGALPGARRRPTPAPTSRSAS